MSGQQYNFPPPPPPPGPPPSSQQQQHPQYGYAQQPQYQQQRGGGPPRGGRGGAQGGRGDFHPSGPYNHQPNGYNGPPQGQGPPQNQGPPQQQGPPSGYNGQNGPQAPYIGPQAPPQHGPQQHGPQGGYGGPQWQPEQHAQQHGPQHHGPPQHQQHPQQPQIPHPAPAPLSAQNYHPNYAPQGYTQPPQYGPQQPPQFQASQHPPSYGHSVPPNQPPQQWPGPPQHVPPQFNNRGRGRGGFNNVRGGHEAPLMGPPIRMGFDNERGDHMAQAGNGFPPQYANHQSPPVPFNQPYQGYPPQNFIHGGGQRPPLDPNPFNSGPQRGRGNMNFRGRGGGRGDFSFRGRDNRHSSNGSQRAPSENFHKPAGAEANGKKKKKRRTNTLGLTPNGVDHDDSDDEIDDVDEEARLVTLLGPDTPQLPSDLEAWLAERRARFPTKARREAAAEELRLRREQGREAKQKNPQIKKEEGETKLERQQRKAEKLRLELEKLERNMSGAKRKRENGDEGDEDRGQVSEDDSDGSSGSESENSKPEAISTRNPIPTRLPPPPKAQLQRHCKYFSTGGTCGKKGKCRFVHDQEVRNQALRDKEANGGKMTLAQRLILNDTAKDDLTILKSIKYLKEKGLMPDQINASAKGDDHPYNGEENGYTENLNYGDN
ncbi:hypothetical protein G7Y89_g8508 [Cudoniella acicularis]|uniref:C3H1-type domain-containing protein n=1 Tax=Cudoniella acicularis TaxID=354080 RepID=A0A8H4RK45_9HELO|nr:hypothetical protein G7Y89_g8508 [Cudoniella acicularis]